MNRTIRFDDSKYATVVSTTELLEEKIKKVSDETDIKIRDAIATYDAELQPTTIIAGIHPKKQSKNKFIQWLLIKLFGYEFEYKTVMAKTIVLKPEDCPTSGDGNFTFTFQEEPK